jgi:hypothetical protein
MWPAMHRIWSTGDFSVADLDLLTSVYFVSAFMQLPLGSLIARFSFLAEFLAAMHESRRCQAAREVHRFEHLLREARAYEARARPAHMQPCIAAEICPLFWAVALAAVAALLLVLVLHSGFQSIDRFVPPSEPFLPYFMT